MFKVTKIAIKVVENFDAFIFALISRLLPWGVAGGPALILGFAASEWAMSIKIPEGEAKWIGASIALAIVAAGAVNAHLAIRYAEAWILVVLTIGLEIVSLFLTGIEAGLTAAPWVGTAAALVQGAVYVGRAWSAKDKQDEEKADEDKDRAWDLKEKLALKRQDDNTRVRLAKVSNKRQIDTSVDSQFDAQSSVNQAQNSPNEPKLASKEDKLDQMINIYLTAPRTGVTDVARQLGVSRQTVYNYQEELENMGKIAKNGQGVIVK